MLTALPGIGLERAQNVLESFSGNAANVLCWLTWLDVVDEVAGIGNGIKTNVRRALGLGAGDCLTVWSDETAAYMKQTMRDEIRAELTKELVTA